MPPALQSVPTVTGLHWQLRITMLRVCSFLSMGGSTMNITLLSVSIITAVGYDYGEPYILTRYDVPSSISSVLTLLHEVH